jgi:lactate permease
LELVEVDHVTVRLAWKPPMPRLHRAIAKSRDVTGHEHLQEKDREPALVDVVPLSSTGTAIFLAAVASGLLLGVGPRTLAAMLAGPSPGWRRRSPPSSACWRWGS